MRRMAKLITLALGVLSASTALAQGGWKWFQPWTPPRAAFESRVVGCGNPQPLNRVAADDWVCFRSGPIVRVTWWGTLSDPAQGARPFYLAIYANQGAVCAPDFDQRLYQACIVPNVVRYRGTDCQNRRVYMMSALLPTTNPFVQQLGTHYWLQISEADQQSIRVGLEDFRWSGHRPIELCHAVQFPPLVTPLLDACDQQPDDLSFALFSRDIAGQVMPPGGVRAPGVLQLDIFRTDGELAETLPVELDAEGRFSANPESPDGTYVAVLRGGGLLPMRQTLMLQDGMCTPLSFFDVFYGDLDGDGHNTLTDLALQLASFGL
jgi:hypothetical protein